IGNTTLSSLHKEHLQANLNLLHNFDNNLEKLLEDLKTLKEPVLLVVFGDHVPNENYLGFSLRDYSDKDIDNFTCPYFAWSNVEIAKFPEKLSSNYLGLYLLKNSFPKDLPVFYRILEKVETTLPVFSFYKSTTEGKLYKNLPENYEKVIELYKLIQYDLLYGEKLSFP
ncbi:MAG: hypothetical protein KDK45_24165, partial [Leptospiraceae bacterium]|nr:hypothetical protein [Leptospiraceae bacterium]